MWATTSGLLILRTLDFQMLVTKMPWPSLVGKGSSKVGAIEWCTWTHEAIYIYNVVCLRVELN